MVSSSRDFHSPFLSARAVLLERNMPPAQARGNGAGSATIIPWGRFVRAVWALGVDGGRPEGLCLIGELPRGVSSQQFSAKVKRAARAGRGEVGVAVRGGRFWVWTIRVPVPETGRRITRARRGWIGELMRDLESGEPVELGWRLERSEVHRVRVRASERGWRVHVSRTAVRTVVQWIGENPDYGHHERPDR